MKAWNRPHGIILQFLNSILYFSFFPFPLIIRAAKLFLYLRSFPCTCQDHQRYPHGAFLKGLFKKKSVIAVLFSMISGKHNHCIFQKSALFQAADDPSDRVVNQCDMAIVAAAQSNDILLRHIPIEIRIFFRRIPGIMRSSEANGAEPGAFLENSTLM